MNVRSSETLQARLMSLLNADSLSPTHRRIGQWILDHPRESLFLSSVELSRQAGVSQASVARFAVAVGFEGYPHMQRRLREVVGAVAEEPERFQDDDRYRRAIAEEQRSLQRLAAESIDPEGLDRLGEELAATHGIVTVGLRHSSSLATYFGYLAAKIHPSVRVITEAGSVAMERLLHAHRDRAGWLVCFALPRYPAELADLLVRARELGFKIVVVSDLNALQLADLSDVMLTAPMGTQLVFDVPVAPMMVAGLLLDAIREARPRYVQDRLDAEEQLAIEIGTFDWPAASKARGRRSVPPAS